MKAWLVITLALAVAFCLVSCKSGETDRTPRPMTVDRPQAQPCRCGDRTPLERTTR